MTFRDRVKEASTPYIAQYKRAPWWVKGLTLTLIGLIILPDPFDWIPGIAFMDELLYAYLLLGLLHRYGAVPGEDKKRPKDLVNDILGRKNNGY